MHVHSSCSTAWALHATIYHVGSIVIACTLGMYVTHTQTDLLLSNFQHIYMHTLCNIHVHTYVVV